MPKASVRHVFAALTLATAYLLSAAAAAAQGPAVCFAPGTPQWRVAEVNAQAAAGTSLSRFQGLPGNRWTLTATDGGGLSQGDPTTLTWSYLADGVAIPPQIPGEPVGPSTMRAWLNGIYGDFNTWHALFVQVFDRWSEVTGVTYVYEPNDDSAAFPNAGGVLGVRGDLRIGGHVIDGNSNVLAYNFFPNTGDMVLDSGDSFFNNTTSNSLRMRNTLAHEHGHGLGMSHVCPINQTKLMEPFLTTSFDGPQHDDVLGGQRGYGDSDESNNSSGSATPIAAGTLADRSVDDNLDTDWFSFAGAGGDTISVTLDPVGLTYLNGPQNANGSCTAGTNFNSLNQVDLGLEVRAPDGTTVLDVSNATGAGGSESIVNLSLPSSGTHFIRIDGVNDAAQLYELSLVDSGTIFADGFESGNTSAWSQTVP